MANFKRGSAFSSGEVNASADAIWAILRDWPAVMKWAAKGPDAPAPLTDTTLKEGSRVDVLPCTRVCHFAHDSGFPPTFEETLIHADPEARRIYYNVEGVAAGGMRNYMATTIVEDLGANRARITCESRFDVPEDADPDLVKDFLEKVYTMSVIQGMERVAQQEQAALAAS